MPEVSCDSLGQVSLDSSINFDLQVCEYRTVMLNIQYQDVESQGKILQVFIQGPQRLAGWSAWLKNKFVLLSISMDSI
jgi:hypothetical protein